MHLWGAVLGGGHIILLPTRNGSPIPLLGPMDRTFLIITCPSIVLLTTAIGLASPPINYDSAAQGVPSLLRMVPS